MTESFKNAPMSQAREGMSVRDSAGQEIGKVAQVKLSDSNAVTAQGQSPDTMTSSESGVPPVAAAVPTASTATPGGPLAAPAGILALGQGGTTEPDVPPPLAERLLRIGYLKIDAKGFLQRDLYVAADQVAAVEDDTVMLRAAKDDLVPES